MTTQEQALTQTESKSSIWSTGLALFSMFFGAGNLIFPLLIGKSVGGAAWYALMGLGLTAVFVPFLGLAAMVLFGADCTKFFGRVGRVPGWLLFLLLQLVLGPFGVVPRLVTLMYAMTKPYLDISLFTFSLVAAVCLYLCSFRYQKLIKLLSVMTPLLLISLVALIGVGLTSGAVMETRASPFTSFAEGALGGYNTMDLIAAFLFATVMLPHFAKETAEESPALRQRSLLKKMFFSSLIAAGLLLLTYIGLCWVSALHAHTLTASVPPEELLGAIATKLLGPLGGGIAAIAVVTACLTTAMTLVAIFARYLQQDLCKEKLSGTAALVITLIITTLFANLGFGGIAAILGPVLQICYPGLIVLTVLNILHKLTGFQMVKWPVLLTFVLSGAIYLLRSEASWLI